MTTKITEFLQSEECEYFSITLVLHSIVLLCLSFIISYPDKKSYILPIVSSISENIVLEDQPLEIVEEIIPSENTSFENPEIEVNEDTSLLVDSIQPPEASSINIDLADIGDSVPSEMVSQNINGLGSNIGAGINNQSSTGGALDRLTLEIIRNSETKDLLVVWLMDASISLSSQREQIQKRFDRILTEIDEASKVHDVNHAVCSFGQSVQFKSDNPTADGEVLKKNISSISTDNSGTENTFGAVIEVCKKYNSYSERLMVVIFTDEIGEDSKLLEGASHLARSKGSMIYVVGSPAPFGKSKTQFKFVEFDPKYESAEKWVQIEQGPETLEGMILDLHSLPIDDEVLDSGYGPFALSKLCSDTGGLFFSVHPNRTSGQVFRKQINPLSSYISRFFDDDVMKLYKPDYRSIAAQNKENSTHITKRALLAASKLPINITGEQTLRFKAFNEGMFSEELSMAQRFSAKLEPRLNEVYNILLSGESAHLSLTDKRWLASYCLAMGRILATKCRIEAYNLVLAEAKSGLKKKDPKSNIWMLIHNSELQTNNSNLRKNYDAANKYLKFVVDNFPNTPWAFIANEELHTPMAYSWVEDYEAPPKPRDGNGGNNNPKDDKMKPKLTPKPQRKIDKI